MNKFKVPIKNALFMYSYIWDKVNSIDLTNLDSNDDFKSSDIYAELFLINIKKILLKGLYKEYTNKNDCLRSVKGRIDFKSTLDKQTLVNGKIYCDFDEFEENNIFNQILKNIALKLYKASDISKENKKKLNNIIFHFNKVDYIELDKNTFKKLKFNRMNEYYFLTLKICELINNNQMLSEETGKYEFFDLFNDDKNMNSIFELFVNKFYNYELDKKYKVKYQSVLKWNFEGGNNDILPDMKTDTLIYSKDETIILDTKYYKEYLSTNYDKKTLISANMYQMLAYLNNINVPNNLRGILLYPLPVELDPINESYNVKVVSNNDGVKDAKIQFITIDLSKKWKEISYDLLSIVDVELAEKKKKELS